MSWANYETLDTKSARVEEIYAWPDWNQGFRSRVLCENRFWTKAYHYDQFSSLSLKKNNVRNKSLSTQRAQLQRNTKISLANLTSLILTKARDVSHGDGYSKQQTAALET